MKRVTADMCEAVLSEMTPLLPPFVFRRASRHDVDSIVSVGRACFSYNPPTTREISHAVTKGHGALVVLEHGPDMAGYVLVDAHAGHNSLYLNTTALLPDFRHQGLGKIFYDFTDRLAVRAEARSVRCHVACDNAVGIARLTQSGYRVTGTIDDYYDDGNAAYAMRKDFA